jgi:hypothetical protein
MEEIKLALIKSNRVMDQYLTLAGRYLNVLSGFKGRRPLLNYYSQSGNKQCISPKGIYIIAMGRARREFIQVESCTLKGFINFRALN